MSDAAIVVYITLLSRLRRRTKVTPEGATLVHLFPALFTRWQHREKFIIFAISESRYFSWCCQSTDGGHESVITWNAGLIRLITLGLLEINL